MSGPKQDEGTGEVDIFLGGETRQILFPMKAMGHLRKHFDLKSVVEIPASIAGWTPEDWVEVIHQGLIYGSMPNVKKEEVEGWVVMSRFKTYMLALVVAFGEDREKVEARIAGAEASAGKPVGADPPIIN